MGPPKLPVFELYLLNEFLSLGKEQIEVYSNSEEFCNLKDSYIRQQASEIDDFERFPYSILYFTLPTYANLKAINAFIGKDKHEESFGQKQEKIKKSLRGPFIL